MARHYQKGGSNEGHDDAKYEPTKVGHGNRADVPAGCLRAKWRRRLWWRDRRRIGRRCFGRRCRERPVGWNGHRGRLAKCRRRGRGHCGYQWRTERSGQRRRPEQFVERPERCGQCCKDTDGAGYQCGGNGELIWRDFVRIRGFIDRGRIDHDWNGRQSGRRRGRWPHRRCDTTRSRCGGRCRD